MSHVTVVMVSGLGGDGRLFEPQRSLPWPILAVDWIEPLPRESLAAYAQRLAQRVKVAPPFFLGGVSMGGMIALEMSRWLHPEAVFLIASGRSRRAIAPLWRLLARAVGLVPLSFAPAAAALVRAFSPAGGELNSEQRKFCWQMANATPPSFVRWGCGAAATWEGIDLPRVPVHHIHGDCDRIMPVSRVNPDRVVHGGGHMINLTHADQVNAYLTDRIAAHLDRTTG
ncbi:alpha/beta hydrolase [Candidatus Sumerlaeota bacterium]|nr:alpha/beta hydrolase [Candidatus Sumerlaeota bacterium]